MHKEIVIGDPREWKTANDSKSGRVYYYNTRTKETTWNKPIELATPSEQKEMIAQKKATLKFFQEMENNIYDRAKGIEPKASRRISGTFDAQGKNKGMTGRDAKVTFVDDRDLFDENLTRTRKGSIGGGPPRRIRTISTVDDEILLSMRQSNGTERKSNMYSTPMMQDYQEEKRSSPRTIPSRTRTGSRDFPDEIPLPIRVSSRDVVDDSPVGVPAKKQKQKVTKVNPLNKRRNSTGTIYLNQTMSKQDNNATIQCVCIVIRAHMIDAARDKTIPSTEYDIFKDSAYVNNTIDRGDKQHYNLSLVPSLAVVKEFFTHIFSKSQLESDCIIMALIYCERLVKETKGKLCIRYDNWRSILFACLVMASKVWDDLSMWNVDFSHVYPSFDLQRVNTLELSMLDALKYVIRVSASEYAKYYFHLRSMITRLGLDAGRESNLIKPLDLLGAKKLQLSTEKYEALNADSLPRRRHMSMHVSGKIDRQLTEGGDATTFNHTLGLDEIIGLEHLDSGGQTKSVSSKSNAQFSHK